jgi:hypothetical protein
MGHSLGWQDDYIAKLVCDDGKTDQILSSGDEPVQCEACRKMVRLVWNVYVEESSASGAAGGGMKMGAHTTLTLTRSQAIAEVMRYMMACDNKELERLADIALDAQLYNCRVCYDSQLDNSAF